MKGTSPMDLKSVVLPFVTILLVSNISLAYQSASPSAQPSSAIPSHANSELSANQSSDIAIREDYLKGVDKTFDAPLAATLAGLALAAAAFLLPLEQKKRDELGAVSKLPIKRLKQQTAPGSDLYIAILEIEQVDKATKSMVWAFYLFVIALANAIFVHPLAALKGQMNVEYLIDLPLAGGGIVLGIGFMVRGGYFIKKIISPGEIIPESNPSQDANGTSQSENKA
jgi:hypothetical protein